MDEELFEGTIRYPSSACFLQVLPGVDGCKSEVWSREMRAGVVDPVGIKAYGSAIL